MKNELDSLNATELLEYIFVYLVEVSSKRYDGEVVELLANMARTLTGADRCSIWIVSDDKQTIRTKIAQGIDPIELPIGSGIVGETIRTGKRYINEDVYTDHSFYAHIDEETGYRTKSMMVIPMYDSEQNVIGAFQVINRIGNDGIFQQRDMERLILATTYATKTILSSKLHKDKEKLEQAQNEITVLGAYGTRAKGYGTTSFALNKEDVIDAGNLLDSLDQESILIQNIWLTHSHLDHIFDIAHIIDNYFEVRKDTINILGTRGTIEAVQQHFLNDKIWPDFAKIKLASGEAAVTYTEIELEREYKNKDGSTMLAFKTDHTDSSCGYIYKKNGRSILITADTYKLDSAIEKINADHSIKSVVLECSFPSRMEQLAIDSKHLTPKLLFEMLKELKRKDFLLYINHIKPSYIVEVTEEIALYKGGFNPILVKDGEILQF